MLNKQGPGKIDWTDYTWNPISGKCLHSCPYCYMHRIWGRFPETAKLQLKTKYLKKQLPKNPAKIFVGSSTDMWGKWVDIGWINQVMFKIEEYPQHTFQFLTKNPERYMDVDWPLNVFFGATIDGTKNPQNIIDSLVECVQVGHRFLSFEPLLNAVVEPDLHGIHWIIIGADSNKGVNKSPVEWATHLIGKAREYGIPVFVKDNYGYPEVIKEFP